MIMHVVLLKPKQDIGEQEIWNAMERIKELQQKIPGMVDVMVGRNFNTSNNKGYLYGFVMHFVDEDHLKMYGPHPAHQVVAAELVRLCQDIIDFDLAL
ncbi:Dabb family protein [Thermogemmatispora sp.]|uniref:Dabb family protein n=1 Tax=Thermogemmatispora sp. TaxID=1968838 RepID=UPI001DBADBB9|nr:Dabb family protein [Thermogemmatispora sp.]MBX5452229.1 Dabb family protein [Thermogemmatispora sp.]